MRTSATITPSHGTNEQNVPAIAALIREVFPELQGRSFAVSDVKNTKENPPTLPLCYTCLLGIVEVGGSNDVATPMDLLETIIVEFVFKPEKYTNADGAVSPFYAYQDYQPVFDRLLTALDQFFAPVRKTVRFLSMATTSDEFEQCISFKLSIAWRWCPSEELDCGAAIRSVRQSVFPGTLPFRVNQEANKDDN